MTLVSLVATTLARLLDAGLERPAALRCALTGGGPVAPALLARAAAAGVPVSLTYGLTEACSQVTTSPLAIVGHGATNVIVNDAPSVIGNRRREQPVTAPQPPSAGPPLFCTRCGCRPTVRFSCTGRPWRPAHVRRMAGFTAAISVD